MKEYEACDEILQHICKTPDEYFTDERIKEELFNEMPQDIITHFYNSIVNFPATHPIVKVYGFGDGGIFATSFTPLFLEQGGFTGIHNREKERLEKESAIKEMTNETVVLELNKLRAEMQSWRQVKKDAKTLKFWTIVASIAAVLSAIAAWKALK